MIQALLVDFDGVLRIWNPENDRHAEESAGLPAGTIRRVAFAQDILTPAITGKITDNEWRTRIVNHLRTEFPDVDVEHAVSLWSASPGTIDHAVLNVIRRCREKAKVALITNATSRLPRDLEALALTNEFDYIVNSSVVGVTKPHPAIFEAALQTAHVSAAATLFIDDNASYVEAAIQLGINGHVYQGIDQLKHALRHHGLL
jgi:putative hydrolase of the HAD superfamily